MHVKAGGWGIFNADGEEAGQQAMPRVLQTLDAELASISRGIYSHFMQKEIHEQPESITSTMRGRVRRVRCWVVAAFFVRVTLPRPGVVLFARVTLRRPEVVPFVRVAVKRPEVLFPCYQLHC